MDIAAIASGLSSSSVGQNVDLGVLKALQNLDQAVAGQLAASIGLGTGIDTYA